METVLAVAVAESAFALDAVGVAQVSRKTGVANVGEGGFDNDVVHSAKVRKKTDTGC